jgi:hypothetical protein
MKLAGLIMACCLLSLEGVQAAGVTPEINLTELLDSGSLFYSLTLEGAKGLAVMVDNQGTLDFETATRLNLQENRKYVMVIIEIMPQD